MANFSKIVLAMAAPAAALAMSALPASALVYTFSGDFGASGGTFGGNFTFDGNTNTFGAINITTPAFTDGGNAFPFVNYAGSTPNLGISNIFTFTQGLSILTFQTATPLVETNTPGTAIPLVAGVTRETLSVIANGNIARPFTGFVTPVPFEFSPVYGVALLGLGFGVSKIKNKFAEKAV
jgi:hypothetical protein